MTELLKKDKFVWGLQAQLAFDKLKMAMSSAPVLALPDFTETFIVESDASGFGLGAFLIQKQNPCLLQLCLDREGIIETYIRKGINGHSHMALKKWRHYLLGKKFIVRAYQKSLKFLLEQKEVSLEYQMVNQIVGI